MTKRLGYVICAVQHQLDAWQVVRVVRQSASKNTDANVRQLAAFSDQIIVEVPRKDLPPVDELNAILFENFPSPVKPMTVEVVH
jgi:hypothetical protein